MRTVKVGDKFKLGPWTWEVEVVGNLDFKSYPTDEHGCSEERTIWLSTKDADSLDWIKEPATISKAAREEIAEWIKHNDFPTSWATRGVNCAALKIKLSSMVRDGE